MYLYRHIRTDLNQPFNSLTEAGELIGKSTGNISNILHSKSNKTREGLTLLIK